MVSGRTVKLKSMKLDGNLLHCHDIEHETGLHKIKIRQHFIQRIKRQTVKSFYHKILCHMVGWTNVCFTIIIMHLLILQVSSHARIYVQHTYAYGESRYNE